MSAGRGGLLSAALLLLGATHQTGTYANEEFAFRVVLPANAATCFSETPEHDHGIAVYLDAAGDGCELLEKRPYIAVGGEHNVAEYASSEQAIAGLCSVKDAKSVTPPEGLTFPGRRSAVCRGDSPDTAWLDIWVVTQAGKSGAPEVNYSANLHTMVSRLDKDLEVFRAFLDSRIKLELPESVGVGVDEACVGAGAGSGTAVELIACMSQEVTRADAALAQRIQDLNVRLSKEDAARFKQSQLAWLRYRELECDANGALYKGASVQPVQVSGCQLFLARERIREVQRILENHAH